MYPAQAHAAKVVQELIKRLPEAEKAKVALSLLSYPFMAIPHWLGSGLTSKLTDK